MSPPHLGDLPVALPRLTAFSTPQVWRVHVPSLCMTASDTGRFEEASRSLLWALQLHPESDSVHFELGLCLRMQERLTESEDAFRAAISLSPLHGQSWKQLGQVLQWQMRASEARVHYALGVARRVLVSQHQHIPLDEHNHAIPAVPWYRGDEYPCLTSLAQSMSASVDFFRDEYVAWRTRTGAMMERQNEGVHKGGDWMLLRLVTDGSDAHGAAEAAPRTMAWLRNVGMRLFDVFTAQFSVIAPGVHIRPHCGVNNRRLTAHAVLSSRNASIRVHRHKRQMQPRMVHIFDDSFEHEVWNHGLQERVTLMLQFKHPALSCRNRGE